MARRYPQTGRFAPVIGLSIVGVFLLLGTFTQIPRRLELKLLDAHFRLKSVFSAQSLQEGVVYLEQNPAVSPDIVILGIDTASLSRFGRWPWPRWRHADLVNTFARILSSESRERALFLDLFFIEPADDAYSDAVLVEAIAGNGRVFLETVLADEFPPAAVEDEFFQRHEVLFGHLGRIGRVYGPWWEMRAHYGLEPPLQPYGAAADGYGHANFDQDWDAVFRRQPLVAKVSRLVEMFDLEQLRVDTPVDSENYERLAWVDGAGNYHTIPHPLDERGLEAVRREIRSRAPADLVDSDGDGVVDGERYLVRRFRDQFVPSITLSLALAYFGRTLEDLEIVLGSHIRIPDVRVFDPPSGEWVGYRVPLSLARYDARGELVEEGRWRQVEEILIPINEHGEMLINYAGPRSSAARDGYQTFPVRSYASYATRVPGIDPSTWRSTLALENKLVMVGPFAVGMAEDEKLTPYGLMYGVEMHANALNTIIMDRFLRHVPWWADLLILFVLVMLVCVLASRLQTIISFAITLVLLIGSFFAVTILFETRLWIINYSSPAIAMILGFVAVVVYRVVIEEQEKRLIREQFGKVVNPQVMEQMINSPPELGGEDREITVLFSNVRPFAARLGPRETIELVNRYLTAMTEVILEYNGTLDKYVDREIMCFWGAPLVQRDHAILACKCALKQLEVLAALNAELPSEQQIAIGIGINTGLMTVGFMGSPARKDYTLAGDAVNLAARLEGTNREYATTILMSEYTHAIVGSRVVARELDDIRVKGKLRPVTIYELLDVLDGLEPAAEELAYETAKGRGL